MQRFCNIYLGLPYIAANSSMLEDTGTSNQLYGIISGPAFLGGFAFAILPIVSYKQGRFLDHVTKPKWILLCALVTASLVNMCTGFAVDIYGIIFPRFAFSIASGFIDPMCFKLLGLYFPSIKRGSATGILTIAIFLGSALASLCLILTFAIGWRYAYIVIGIFCAVTALICMPFIKNDTLPYKPKYQVQNLCQDAGQLFATKSQILIITALFFQYLAGFSRVYFDAFYFTEAFPDHKIEYSWINAIAIACCPLGSIAAGYFTDYKERQEKHFWRPLCVMLVNFVSSVLVLVIFQSSNFTLTMICLVLDFCIGQAYLSVSYTMLLNLAVPRIWALQTSWMICSTYIAGCIATVTVGSLVGNFEIFQMAMTIITVSGTLLSGLLFLALVWVYPRDINQKEDKRRLLIAAN